MFKHIQGNVTTVVAYYYFSNPPPPHLPLIYLLVELEEDHKILKRGKTLRGNFTSSTQPHTPCNKPGPAAWDRARKARASLPQPITAHGPRGRGPAADPCGPTSRRLHPFGTDETPHPERKSLRRRTSGEAHYSVRARGGRRAMHYTRQRGPHGGLSPACCCLQRAGRTTPSPGGVGCGAEGGHHGAIGAA